MANKKAVGRPPKFKTKEEIQEKIDRYFESCEGEILKNSKGEVVLDRFGKPVYIDQKPPTVTGLALALGFSGRQSLLNYQSKAEFVDTIMRAKSRVEEYTEQRLFDRDGSDGAKFSLRNNFRGWDDKPQSEMDQEEQRIRIEYMQAQVEQTRAQMAKIKAQTGEGEEIADDGFLEALKGAAAEDWFGENYSKRIWRNTKELAQTVKEELLVNLLTGRTDREVAKIITYRFASGASKVRRLVRTESNFISSELNHEAYKESGVAEYQYLATLDLKTSEICQALDKKIFKASERKVGVNCNPMHPWCRSTTVTVIDQEFLDMGMRSARDPETGKTIKVPASMNYKEWYEKFVGGKDEAKPAEKKLKNKSADRRQHEKYREILGDNVPDNLDDFQEMKYNNSEKWNTIKASFRRGNNKGTPFESLQEPLQLKHVKKVFSERGIDYGGTKITIDRREELIGKPYLGWTNPNLKEVQLYPSAFINREQLVKTLGHERIHMEQVKMWGPATTNEESLYYEQGPRISEDYWWSEYLRRTGYAGK